MKIIRAIYQSLKNSKDTLVFIGLSLLGILIIFLAGVAVGYMKFNKPINDFKVQQAQEKITVYSNRLYTNYRYISYEDNVKYDELLTLYNNLLKESRDNLTNVAVIQEANRRLNRKLYFLLGGNIKYSIRNQKIDLGLNAGIEYKRIGVAAGYYFFGREITLTAYYRF